MCAPQAFPANDSPAPLDDKDNARRFVRKAKHRFVTAIFYIHIYFLPTAFRRYRLSVSKSIVQKYDLIPVVFDLCPRRRLPDCSCNKVPSPYHPSFKFSIFTTITIIILNVYFNVIYVHRRPQTIYFLFQYEVVLYTFYTILKRKKNKQSRTKCTHLNWTI